MAGGSREFKIDEERARLRKLSEKELIREGKAARSLCSANAKFGQPAHDVFVIGLRLCKEEWRRRHPKTFVGLPQ